MVAVFVMGGCSGGATIGAEGESSRIQPLDEVAVVSVRTKKVYQNELGEPEVEEATDVRQAVSTITEETERQSRRADPRFQAASVQVRDSLFGPFRAVSPFSLVEEAAVLQSAAYHRLGGNGERAAENRDWRASLFATPDGYRSLAPTQLNGSSTRSNAASALPSAPDGLLFADVTYTLVTDRVRRATRKGWEPDRNQGTRVRTTLSSGDTVAVDVEATVRIRIVDRTGQTAMTVTQTARSDDGFTFVYGEGWTTAQIDGAAERATSAVLEKVTSHLQNKLPKRTLAGAATESNPRAVE
jgi:hypothetical protein